MTRKIYCFDIDGTLFDHKGYAHPRDVEVLNNLDHQIFIPSTGRPLHSVRRGFERYRLWKTEPIPLPMVLEGGAALYLPGEKLLRYITFDPSTQAALIRSFSGFNDITFTLHHAAAVHVVNPTPFAEGLMRSFDFITRPFDEKSLTWQFTKVSVISRDRARLEEYMSLTSDMEVEQTRGMDVCREILPRGINKAEGLKVLLKEMGIEAAEIYVAGDGGNDLQLFELASLKFAPRTSPSYVLSKADWILDVAQTGILVPMMEAASQPFT